MAQETVTWFCSCASSDAQNIWFLPSIDPAEKMPNSKTLRQSRLLTIMFSKNKKFDFTYEVSMAISQRLRFNGDSIDGQRLIRGFFPSIFIILM